MLKNTLTCKLLFGAIFLNALVLSATAVANEADLPLAEGMVEVAVSQSKRGDEEQVMTITELTPAFVDFSVEFRYLKDNKPATDTRTRRVRTEDLANSSRQNIVFQPGDAPIYPGSTLIHLSTASLSALKTQGKTPLIIGTIKRDLSMDDLPAILDISSGRKYFRGTLERVGTDTVPMNILVNGKSVSVPTIHGKGVFSVAGDNLNVELWILDNPANPMMLRMRGDSGQRQTIRINYPPKQPQQSALQQALSTGECRAALHGIYFDFAKASLLPQSAVALRTVADLMHKNPDWTLRIEGHTDNIGGDAYNLDLSKRRAAAVNAALTTDYKLSPTRLSSEGFGAGKPVAKNDTLEGRAANRRVELARTCP